LTNLVAKYKLSDCITFDAQAVAGSVGKVVFPNCPQEREDCYINSRHVTSESAEVPSTTIDHEFERHDMRHIYLLSVDTEGYDYDVLKGAKATLSSQ